MRQFSLKRQKIKNALILVVAQIRKDRAGKCDECGYAGITDPSHNYCQKDYESLIADPENITLLCRRHHNSFQDNKLCEFKSDKVLRHMKWQYENEPDQFRATSMRQHLNGKLSGAIENAELWGATLPGWVEELLNETQF